MGVVRREGDWRLEKRSEGVYVITFQREPQMRVLTSEGSTRNRAGPTIGTTPVREVSSFNEAEGLFQEKAHGPPPLGMSSSTGGRSSSGTNEDFDLSDLSPLGFGVSFLGAGALLLYVFHDASNSYIVLFAVGSVGIGIIPFAYAGYLFRTEGLRSAWNFLVTVDDDSNSSNSTTNEGEKTPPAPEKLKNRLIFDRAGQQCEWCEESFDHLQVHHIEPRREGGPNGPENLIVLCPNCHENADREAIPRSKLKAKVKRLPAVESA